MTLHTGDCLEVMAGMPDASVDAVVTDPPYGLEFMGKGWDKFGVGSTTAGTTSSGWKPPSDSTSGEDGPGGEQVPGGNPAVRPKLDVRQPGDPTFHKSGAGPFDRATVRHGFYSGKTLPALVAFQAWCTAWGREALRVTVPGGYLLAFGGTRTHHRLVCGLEDAGWIIRDELDWIYASGFPKGKANLKPAHEPIVLARKPGPLRMLGIDETRIPLVVGDRTTNIRRTEQPVEVGIFSPGPRPVGENAAAKIEGRWPANVILTDPVFDGGVDGVVGGGDAPGGISYRENGSSGGMWGQIGEFPAGTPNAGYGDSGTYSRFFLIPKADRGDREPLVRGEQHCDCPNESCTDGHLCGRRLVTHLVTHGARKQGPLPQQTPQGPIRRANSHPTVKPIELMRHLVRLVTPPGGTVLDPFLGSGTTAIACEMEGFAWIGIEKEPEYVAIAEARLNGVQKGLGLPA